MAIIAPTVIAETEAEYKIQMDRVIAFASRIQIDLTDGIFASPKTISAENAWWPVSVKADFHLMFKNPEPPIRLLLDHKPNLIIFHAEADGKFEPMARICRQAHVKVGVALLPNSRPETILPALNHIDHVLIFSGDLGKFGGRANLDYLRKVHFLKHHKPNLEIGWDGGVNNQNVSQLVSGGVDVLNVGGAIQKADNPERAFHSLQRIASETGSM